MDKKKRLVFQLDTPYSAVSWPELQPRDQDTILQLLCGLLSPLGHYRSQHVKVSKGKRAKKRKQGENLAQDAAQPVPPAPELRSYIDIGLSSVSRCLQQAVSKTSTAEIQHKSPQPGDSPPTRFYSVIFVARSGQPNALSSHLPQMVAVASKCQPSLPPIRLVELPKACESRLSDALGIPRVSCVGLCVDAPNSQSLVEFVQSHVPAIEVPWLSEAIRPEHRATKINTIETTIGARKKARDKVTG
ncbi:hypothetical protein F5Y17DRAFT_423823 [Xylariaceae sp. FL0594]|nr:hypothetical protein F5Y17DRAFT_423823 [Xylariaceae sp. FL0594]